MYSRESFLHWVQSSEVQRHFWLEINHNTLQMRRERPIPCLTNLAGAIPTSQQCAEKCLTEERLSSGAAQTGEWPLTVLLWKTEPLDFSKPCLESKSATQAVTCLIYSALHRSNHVVDIELNIQKDTYSWDIISVPGSSSKPNPSVFSHVA